MSNYNYPSLHIDMVVEKLGLEVGPKGVSSTSYNVKCPFCNDRKYRLNVNRQKNVFNCVHCGANGSVLDLYSMYVFNEKHTSGKDGNTRRILKDFFGDKPVNKITRPSLKIAEYKAIYPCENKQLHKVYSVLLQLDELKLTEDHRNNLLKRGLSLEQITFNRYRSVKSFYSSEYEKYKERFDKENLMAELRKYDQLKYYSKQRLLECFIIGTKVAKLVEPSNTPGFFKIKGYWFFRLEEGMLIPTRTSEGHIVGMQTRKDKGELRYMTVSSKGLPEGVTENIVRTHIPKGCVIHPSSKILLTEGPLKADIIKYLLNNEKIFVIAVQGVHSTSELMKLIPEIREMGFEKIYDAFDMDKFSNMNVGEAIKKIKQATLENNIKLETLSWDNGYAKDKFIYLTDLCKKYSLSYPKELSYTSIYSLSKDLLLSDKLSEEENDSVKHWDGKCKGLDDFLVHYPL